MPSPVAQIELPEVSQKAFDAAHDMIHALCTPRGSEGHRDWVMSIPAQPNYDPDLVIANGLIVLRDELLVALTKLSALREASEKSLEASDCQGDCSSSTCPGYQLRMVLESFPPQPASAGKDK